MGHPLQRGHFWRRLAGAVLAGVLMAVSATAQPTGTVRGTVVEAATETPIERAAVSVRGASGVAALTDEKGRFRIGIPAGERVLRIRAEEYCATTRRVDVAPGRYLRIEVDLQPLQTCQDEQFQAPKSPSV